MSHYRLLVVVAAACHGPALPSVPGSGGPAWHELQSEHFTLWTDASESRGRYLIREMEHLRQIVLGVGLANGPAEGRSFVLALRDREEVNVFVPSQFIAYAWSDGGMLQQPMIVIPADPDEHDRAVITHELTHVVSYNIVHHQPHWFAEGLANFFATVRLDPSNASGDLGTPLDYIVARVKAHPPTPVAAMFACDKHECMDEMFYATAWAMFTFLANEHPTELLSYADRLDQLPKNASAQAWTEVFPKLTPDVFDSELRKWLVYGRHRVWKFNVKLQESPVTVRALADADVYAARALLRHLFAADPSEVPSELAAALAADPTNVLAKLIEANIKKTITTEGARSVATAHPDDWRAWFLVGIAADASREDKAMARDKMCALMAAAHITRPMPYCEGR